MSYFSCRSESSNKSLVVLDKAEELKLRTAERAAGKKIRRLERGGHSSATLKELDRTHSMTPPLRHSITSLPTELLELVCSFLNARDITKVEAVCRHLRARLREGRVWKAHAERFTLRLRSPVCAALVHYAKKHNLEGRQYKTSTGIAAERQRSVVEGREACQKYGEARRDEETKYRTHKLLGVNQTGRGFNMWLKNIMKVSIQVWIYLFMLERELKISQTGEADGCQSGPTASSQRGSLFGRDLAQ
jgi:hypothetical protein